MIVLKTRYARENVPSSSASRPAASFLNAASSRTGCLVAEPGPFGADGRLVARTTRTIRPTC
jgi:hypothetical protein